MSYSACNQCVIRDVCICVEEERVCNTDAAVYTMREHFMDDPIMGLLQ